ncbi:MAG TPA: hypothetical protein VGN17_03070 [Bryobacteraceae bacterium]|jgi:hypothetical protein
MFSLKRVAVLVSMAAGIAVAQPALTTIQDTLYRADGTRYNGTIFITWDAFQGGDTSEIATANLTLPIVNGVLRVNLVPTTTASAGAQYNVTYNMNGINQFTQVWAVPPSSVPLRIRDILVSQGTVVGPPPVTNPVQISDVVGLSNALSLTTQKGVGFQIDRAAVVNGSGQIDGASGNLTDCVHVDGSSGPCGSGSVALPGFADFEIPGGAVNGSNSVFTLAFPPSPAGSLALFRNGLRLESGQDFTLSGSTITFFLGSIPQTGDLLGATYRFASTSNPLGALPSPQVVCSGSGGVTSATTLTQLNSCTVAAGLLTTGDRLAVEFQYVHTGSAVGFTGEVHVGGTAIISRAAASTETLLVGKTSFGTFSGGEIWDTQSWGGATLTFLASAGTATEDITQALTVSFLAKMTSSTTDTVAIRNFTVIRYPAQVNP